jgi:hypothetical protein
VTGGSIHAADPTAAQAQNELTTAYNAAAGATSTGTLPGNLAGLTFTPGVYTNASSVQNSGIVTLSGAGQFIFQIGSTLTTATSSSVVLINGAQASNIFWQVGSSATLGTTSAFSGNILALTSITLTTGASLQGRALARNGAVTLDSNSVNNPGGPGGPGGPPVVPAPPSLILVTIALVCVGIYQTRERLLKPFRC